MTIDRYQEICAAFRWRVPEKFNIGRDCCGRWAGDRYRFALYYEDDSSATSAWTYWDLQQQANRLSNALAAMGVRRGDRVAIILPQRPETAIAHIACYQMGAVAMPLSVLFGPEALQYRIDNSESAVAIVDDASLANLLPVRNELHLAAGRLATGDERPSALPCPALLKDSSCAQHSHSH